MVQRTTKSPPGPPGPSGVPPSIEGAATGLRGSSLIELITVQWQRERSDLDLSDFLLAIYLMRLGTIIERAFDRLCEQRHGISGSDMRVLFALRRGGPPYVKRPTDLFRALLVTSGAITKKVDRLAALDMVERLQDPGHQGGFLVRLTKKGVHIADAVVETLARESAIAPAMQQFTKGERDQVAQLVLRMLSALESAGLDEPPGEDEVYRNPRGSRGRRVGR
jgi:DNA-binding MarR family transcriptional regulator